MSWLKTGPEINGYLALLGSGEYLPVMAETDRFLLANSRANGHSPRVICLPTAAGTEGDASVSRWMQMGEAHFRGLGAEVSALKLTNRVEAERDDFAEQIRQADLVYFSGGKPHYLYETLNGTKAWQAVLEALARGAALAGCSAGAMFLGEFLPDLRSFGLRQQRAFGILPKSHILPHFDRLSAWRGLSIPLLQSLLPEDEYVLGLDEDTALVGKPGQDWTVMGRQKVYLIGKHSAALFASGEKLRLPE
jgi:cyanophycinase-like exopeptidase